MARKIVFEVEAINKKFNQALDQSLERTEALRSSLASIAAVSGAAFAGLTAGVAGFIKEAAEIETINTQFEVLTGSVLGAEKAVKQLQEFSASTPFQFADIAQAGKQLLGFGFSTDELKGKLTSLGNVAAASGTPIQGLSLIFGQVAAAGKLTGERLLQFEERAIPIGPAIAKTLGVAESSVRKLVSQGKVDFATFEKAFNSLSEEGGFAFGGLEKQSATLSGKISTLKDNFALTAGTLGKEFLPIAKQVVQSFIDFFQRLRKDPALLLTATRILKVATVTTGLISTLAAASIGYIKLKAAVSAAIVAFKAFRISATAAKVALTGGIGVILVAVAGLAATWDSNLSFIENITQNWFKRIKTLFSGVGNVFKSVFTLDLQGIKDGLAEASAAFASSAEEVEKKRDEVEQRRVQRQEKELQDQKDKIALLEAEELAADERKKEREELKRQQKLERDREIAEEDRAIQAEVDKIKFDDQLKLTKKEQKLLAEDIKKKRQQKDQRDTKDLLKRIEKRKKEQEIEQKFGTAFLNFQKLIDSERFKSAESLARRNIKLQQSSNSILQSIGKASAITQIGIDSFKGAMAVFAQSVATFPPPFGPALGAGLAAAQIAFGAEQIRNVLAARQGGMVEGTGRGDRIPALLEAGELVVPRQNFEDVIEAEAARRSQENEDSPNNSAVEVIVGFRDEAIELIEEKIIERRTTGVGLI